MSRWIKILLLLFFFALCGTAMIATHLTQQRIPAPSTHELFSAVNRQLSALRAADFNAAYQRAAAGVQEKFSRAQFELMIRRDFASMTGAAQVEFGAVEIAGASAFVQVFLTTPEGAIQVYLYSFTAERDGWKIDGVRPLGRERIRHLPGVRI
jgi:hypothetical protein